MSILMAKQLLVSKTTSEIHTLPMLELGLVLCNNEKCSFHSDGSDYIYGSVIKLECEMLGIFIHSFHQQKLFQNLSIV